MRQQNPSYNSVGFPLLSFTGDIFITFVWSAELRYAALMLRFNALHESRNGFVPIL